MSEPKYAKTIYLSVDDYNKSEALIAEKELESYSKLVSYLLATLNED